MSRGDGETLGKLMVNNKKKWIGLLIKVLRFDEGEIRFSFGFIIG